MKDSAVLIIDVQRGLFDANSKPYESDRIINNINNIASKARNSKKPVIFIQHESESDLLEYKSESWNLVPELYVVNSDYKVRKSTPDSFLDTKLNDILKALGIKNLIICGYATEYCIDTTVRKSLSLNYNVQLVFDGHTTHDKKHLSAKQIIEHHNSTLSNLTSFKSRANVIKSKDIIFGE